MTGGDVLKAEAHAWVVPPGPLELLRQALICVQHRLATFRISAKGEWIALQEELEEQSVPASGRALTCQRRTPC